MFGVPGKGNSGVLTSSECETVNILISVNDVITTLLVSVTIIINVSLLPAGTGLKMQTVHFFNVTLLGIYR